jgi:DNA-binding transcriptional LysR family regulator
MLWILTHNDKSMITFRMIEAFRAIIINGSVSEAATFMHISQPAVSRLIKDLEYEIGFSLFDRRNARIFANEDALAFYDEIQRSYIGLERIYQAAEIIKKKGVGKIRIACMPAVGLSIMPKVIAQFQKIHPGINLQTLIVRSSTVMQLLASKQCDIGFVESSYNAPMLEEGPIFNLPCVCALPPGHTLAKQDWVKPKHLDNEIFISLGSESKTRSNIDRVFEQAGINRQMLIESPLMSMACTLVLEGCGVSIVDPLTSAMFERQGLIVKPFKPEVSFSFKVLSSLHSSENNLHLEFKQVFISALTSLQEITANNQNRRI